MTSAPDQLLYSHHLAEAGYRNAYVGKWHCGHEKLPVDYGIEGWSLPDYGKIYMSEAYQAYAESRGFGPARARIEHSLDHPDWEGQTALVLHDPSPVDVHERERRFWRDRPRRTRSSSSRTWPSRSCGSWRRPVSRGAWSRASGAPISPTTRARSSRRWSIRRAIPEYPSFRDDLSGRPLRHFLHRDFHHTGAKRLTDWSIWQEILARCYAQALQLDAAVGTILDALEELGAAENTLVIWCADHGDAVASHGGLWDKASTFTEEVARIPMAVRWPAAFGGSRRERAGQQHGRDCHDARSRRGGRAGGHEQPLAAADLCRGDDRTGPICWSASTTATARTSCSALRYAGQYKYVAALYDGDELYDLDHDPYEMHNLIDSASHKAIKRGAEGADHPAHRIHRRPARRAPGSLAQARVLTGPA